MRKIVPHEWEDLTDSEIKALVKKEMVELYGDNIANDVVDIDDMKRMDNEAA